jgi:hypothetical protein
MGIMTRPAVPGYTRPHVDSPLYALCGLIVGALVGLTGVGGGSLMTPILVLVFGQPPAVAVGTDLMFSASTKLVATASFGFSRRVDWRIVARLASAVFRPPPRSFSGFGSTIDHRESSIS